MINLTILRQGVIYTFPDSTGANDKAIDTLIYRITGSVNDFITAKLGGKGNGYAVGQGYGVWYVSENLAIDSGVETNACDWTAGGCNTRAQSSDQVKFGAQSLKTTYIDSADLAFDGITLTAASYIASAYTYIPTNWDNCACVNVDFSAFVGATGDVSASACLCIRDEWQRVSTGSYTIDAGDLAGFIALRQANCAPTAGRFVYFDGVQVELPNIVTPSIATDGAAATRTAGLISAPAASLCDDNLWWAMGLRPGFAAANCAIDALSYMASWGAGGAAEITLFYRDNGNLFRLFVSDGCTCDVVSSPAQTFAADSDNVVVVYATPAELGVSVNGATYTTAVNNQMPTISNTTWSIGRDTCTAQRWGNTMFSWVAAGKGCPPNAQYFNSLGAIGTSLGSLLQTIPSSFPTFYWNADNDFAEVVQ